MKRLLTLAVLFLCCAATSFAQYSMSGSGTESDPYKITQPFHLNQLRNYLNMEDVYFILMNDIDLTEFLEDESPTQGWQPVGNSEDAAFKGILDGNGKTISGLWINRRNTSHVGFFGYTSGATIKNLNVVATTVAGSYFVGGVAGYSDNSTFSSVTVFCEIQGYCYLGGITGRSDNSTFSSVTVSCKIQGASDVGGIIGMGGDITLINGSAIVDISATGNRVGGLMGYLGDLSSITECRVEKSKLNGRDYVGGACGEIEAANYNCSLSSCFIYADVSGNSCVGGIYGYGYNRHSINVNNCGYIGNVSAEGSEGNSYVGGLVGYLNGYENTDLGNTLTNHTASLTDCFAIGTVSAEGDYAGGLIGFNNGGIVRSNYNGGNISHCYFSGAIIGKNYTAGLVGYKKYGTISNSYAMTSIAGTKYVGGLVGYSEGAIVKTSVAINSRVTATEGEVARIVGYNAGTIAAVGSTEENKSYNRTIVINQGVASDVMDDLQNGTGVSANTLKLKATYEAMGFNFDDTWEIQGTECYPYMKCQTAPPVIKSQLVSGATVVNGKCVDGGTVTIEVDGVKQQKVSSGHEFSFAVNPLQAGHDVRLSAKANGKEQSYLMMESVSYLGKGTEADPYRVYTAADLTGVYRRGYFKLMNDIDLTDYINQFSPTEGWQSIGRDGSETIHFDGNGHKITGLWCNTTRNNTGLFSTFANGEIKNLTVEVANSKQVKGGTNTGIIIGKMVNGTIENCLVSGAVIGDSYVGGIVGFFDGGRISRSSTTATIGTENGIAVGGIAGEIHNCDIVHSQASVTITATGSQCSIGGVSGIFEGGTIDECETSGVLMVSGGESYAGGLVGKNRATVTNCYSTATVTSSYNAAGLVAYNYGVVDKCYATGDLTSRNFAAGVVGYNDGESAVIRNCAAMNNKIDLTYESQQVQQGGGYGMRIIGGYKNNAPAPEMNNYALKTMQVSVNDVPQSVYDDIFNGTAKTDAELKQKATYQELGWDFDNVWNIDENTTYPYQTVIVESGSDPDDPNNPDNPDAPQGEVEVTDISTMNNVIYVESMEEMNGSQATISLKMKNTAAIRGFQFDLYLPEGVTVVKSSKGKIQGFLSIA